MQQSGTVDPQTRSAPQEPIVVLGKKNDYLFVGTVEQAVENIYIYLSADTAGDGAAEDSKEHLLRFDELDFFDAAGQRLEPVVVTGQLQGLIVQDPQEELHDRIRRLFRAVEPEIRKTNRNLDEVPLARIISEASNLGDLLRKLAYENEKLERENERLGKEDQIVADDARGASQQGCTWWDRVCGRC